MADMPKMQEHFSAKAAGISPLLGRYLSVHAH
jgi:hypothetical protein